MKKSLFFLLLITFILNVSAQNLQENAKASATPFDYGLHFGTAFSGLTHYRAVFSGYKTGIVAGLFCEYHPYSFAGISLEANYTTLGGSGIAPDLIYPGSILTYRSVSVLKSSSELCIRTLEVPIMINFRPVSGDFIPVFSLGYSFDYFLGATSKDMVITNGSYSIPLTYRSCEDVTSYFNKIDQSIICGAGVEFPVSKFACSIQARYKVGLMNISGLSGLKYNNHQYDFSMNTFSIILSVKMNNL